MIFTESRCQLGIMRGPKMNVPPHGGGTFRILLQGLGLSTRAAMGTFRLIYAASADSKGKPVGSWDAGAAERLQNHPHIVAFWLASTTSRAAYRLLVQFSNVCVGRQKARQTTGMDSINTLIAQGENLMSWTDERVELLKKLWADGLSASQIAAELGGITRNAVIGKVHRLGLSGRAKSPSSSSPRPRKARSSGMMRVSRPSIRGNTALAYEYELEPEPELFEIPVEQRKTLLELSEKTCRWPVGDPGSSEFFFC